MAEEIDGISLAELYGVVERNVHGRMRTVPIASTENMCILMDKINELVAEVNKLRAELSRMGDNSTEGK